MEAKVTGVEESVREHIRTVPDFPKPGIMFKDITPLLADSVAFGRACDWMASVYPDVDVVVGLESRGFIFGVPVAQRLGVPFIPARKKGKLPCEVFSESYSLEYGQATLEMHRDAMAVGAKVLICDDLLATGGTADAAVRLANQAGGVVIGCVFLIELDFLNGRECLEAPVSSLIHYP